MSNGVAKLPKLKKPLVLLPNELWLHIFELTPCHNLLNVRLVSRSFAQLANVSLKYRLQSPLQTLSQKSVTLHAMVRHLRNTKTPHLEHYQEFLRQSSPSDLTEVIWYTSPPQELRTVCECLLRLKDPELNKIHDPLSWAFIKRSMSKYEFKSWFLEMQTTVNDISIESTLFVENIIRMDPLITYERLRDVSRAGYRLLIKVAASLQYCNILNEMRKKERESKICDNVLERTIKFTNAINGPLPTLGR